MARGAGFDDVIENIDIGGRRSSVAPPRTTMTWRGGGHVDYAAVLSEVQLHGGTTLALRKRLAQTAYARNRRL